MSEPLDDLYREVILDHYRSPRNRRVLTSPTITAHGVNPVCGDEIFLQLTITDGRVVDIGFGGKGCAISQASSSMMAEALEGKDLAQVRELTEVFKRMMRGDEVPLEELGDLEALQGVTKFPVRIKCALLPWTTLEEGLASHS